MTVGDLIETMIEMPISEEHLRHMVRRVPELHETRQGRRAVKASYKLSQLLAEPDDDLHYRITRRGQYQGAWRHLGVQLGYMAHIV